MENLIKSQIGHIYSFQCFDKDGNLKWEEEFENLVTTVGLNHYLDATIKTGSAAPVWYLGLKNTTATVAGDTMASKGWTEITAYSQANRVEFVDGTISAGSVSNTENVAVFSINGSATVGGGFLVNQNTKGGTTGILLGGGEFGVARAVENGDTINLTCTLSITSA